jgi:hypothetical protein
MMIDRDGCGRGKKRQLKGGVQYCWQQSSSLVGSSVRLGVKLTSQVTWFT